MNERSPDTAFELFLGELRRLLPHLYDPLEMRETPLFDLFGLRESEHQVPALRQVLVNAIQELEPGSEVPIHSTTWRVYHILRYRYVEQSAQRTVANNLGLSERQLRRQERDAEEALASHLWTRHALQQAAERIFSTFSVADKIAGNGEQRERELEWVRRSFPSEITDIAETIDSALKTVAPLTESLQVRVTCKIEEGLPPVTGQRMLLRQALLSLLTSAVHSAPGGEILLSAEQQAQSVFVCLRTGRRAVPVSDVDSSEHLQMARQCIGLFGGELVVSASEESASSEEKEALCLTALRLPVTEPAPVLVVDDNTDTLQLFQRYLSATRYRFVGIHNPEEALSVAESCLPTAIVLDVMLPEIDGWELLGRLRQHPLTHDVPIIVCTVMPQEQLALALGAAAYLRKPVTREEFISTLDRVVNSHTTESD